MLKALQTLGAEVRLAALRVGAGVVTKIVE